MVVLLDAFSTEESALLFIKCFFITMGREWFGIDKWRMDKFMMMARRFLRQVGNQRYIALRKRFYNYKQTKIVEIPTKYLKILTLHLFP